MKTLEELDWFEFEKLCKTYFERRGFQVRMTQFEADGGVDLNLFKDGHKAVVQCKHHSKKVGVEPVRAFYGVMAAQGLSKGYFVALNGFTDDAASFAYRKFGLIDGVILKNFFGATSDRFITRDMIPGEKVIICPKCRSAMALRVRKKGHGDPTFFGCTKYPRCRGIISMDKAYEMGYVPQH